ncbi:MAG: hypothetical protein OJF60_001370 [Burkholderiaceae bacterium]|nr:MAG: hypothetical protein OJF60_001370 [Burkholderiaceae bacterium]
MRLFCRPAPQVQGRRRTLTSVVSPRCASPESHESRRHRRPRSRPCADTRGAGFAGPLGVPP